MMFATIIIISVAAIFLGGAAMATGHGLIAVGSTALGIGWLVILVNAMLDSLRRLFAELERVNPTIHEETDL